MRSLFFQSSTPSHLTPLHTHTHTHRHTHTHTPHRPQNEDEGAAELNVDEEEEEEEKEHSLAMPFTYSSSLAVPVRERFCAEKNDGGKVVVLSELVTQNIVCVSTEGRVFLLLTTGGLYLVRYLTPVNLLDDNVEVSKDI